MKKSFAVLLALVVFAVNSTGIAPAMASTVNLTPSSTIAFDNPYGIHMRFDALERLWIWNTVSNVSVPESSPRLAIYEKGLSGWDRVKTVRFPRLGFASLRFSSDGTAYATNFSKNEIVRIPVKPSGDLGKPKYFKLKGSYHPHDAYPAADNRLYVTFSNRVDVFKLPLKKKKLRPIRSITMVNDNYAIAVANADGDLFVAQGDTYYAPIRVFGPTQSGAATPERTILIDSSLSSIAYVTDLAMTPDGQIGVAYWGDGVARFAADASGASVTPATWYPEYTPITNLQGVDFSSTGAMAIGDFGSGSPVNVYFEDGCVLRVHRAC